MAIKVLNVEGMTCQHCVQAVESSLKEVDGVHNVAVNLENGEVTVDYDEDKATVIAMTEAVEEQGYDVKN